MNEFENVTMLDQLLFLLSQRGWSNRDRLFRKLVEELGEYAEAVEYDNGSSKKIEKFKNICSSKEKLQEEICDLIMMAFALARDAGLRTNEVLRRIWKKLEKHQENYNNSLENDE